MKSLNIALLAIAATASAHEVQDNRATLVLRDQTHISITVYLSYCDVLHSALAPQRSLLEFLMVYSAMRPVVFEKELHRAETGFENGTRLYLADGKQIPLANWVFPDTKSIQTAFQHRVMGAIADPAAHIHDEPLEVHADANSPEPITAIRIQFPEEFQRVLVVAYRPNQLWVEPKAWSPPIKF